jgi:hypothetical protein
VAYLVVGTHSGTYKMMTQTAEDFAVLRLELDSERRERLFAVRLRPRLLLVAPLGGELVLFFKTHFLRYNLHDQSETRYVSCHVKTQSAGLMELG